MNYKIKSRIRYKRKKKTMAISFVVHDICSKMLLLNPKKSLSSTEHYIFKKQFKKLVGVTDKKKNCYQLADLSYRKYLGNHHTFISGIPRNVDLACLEHANGSLKSTVGLWLKDNESNDITRSIKTSGGRSY